MRAGLRSQSDGKPTGWLRRLGGYVGRYRREVLLAFGAAFAGTLLATATPLLERWIVDHAVVGHDASLAPALTLLVLFGLARFGFGYIRRWWGGRLSLDVQYDLRDEVFASLQRLDGARLADLDTGQLVSRASSDITLVQGLLAFLPNMSGQVLLFFLSLIVMAVLSPLLTVVALLVGPALAVIAFRSRRKLSSISEASSAWSRWMTGVPGATGASKPSICDMPGLW